MLAAYNFMNFQQIIQPNGFKYTVDIVNVFGRGTLSFTTCIVLARMNQLMVSL